MPVHVAQEARAGAEGCEYTTGFPRKTTLASVELWRGPPFGPSGHGSPPPVKSRLTTLLLIARASTATCEAHEIEYP